MGFSFTVTLPADPTEGVECWLDSNGRLRDAKNDLVYTDRVFADEWDAEMFLLTDLFSQFTGAYMAKKKSRSYRESPTIAALEAAGIEPTLTEWLACNEATETFDYELLESLPEEFHDEYIERVRQR
jgi:hypothetical protein